MFKISAIVTLIAISVQIRMVSGILYKNIRYISELETTLKDARYKRKYG